MCEYSLRLMTISLLSHCLIVCLTFDVYNFFWKLFAICCNLTFRFDGTEFNESNGLRYRDKNQEVFLKPRRCCSEGKAINHLPGGGPDKTVELSVHSHLSYEHIWYMTSASTLRLASTRPVFLWRHTYQTSSGRANSVPILVCAIYSSGWRPEHSRTAGSK